MHGCNLSVFISYCKTCYVCCRYLKKGKTQKLQKHHKAELLIYQPFTVREGLVEKGQISPVTRIMISKQAFQVLTLHQRETLALRTLLNQHGKSVSLRTKPFIHLIKYNNPNSHHCIVKMMFNMISHVIMNVLYENLPQFPNYAEFIHF